MYIHIYHTNDIHAEYNTFRKIAAYLRKHKTEYDFYFDSGDFMDLKSIMVQADKGISAMELMSACRLDAMCIGNNEIDLENEAIVNLCKKNFPLISANLTDKEGGVLADLKSHMLFERCGKRFLVMGLSPYYLRNRNTVSTYNTFFMLGNLKTQNPFEAIRNVLAEQKGNYDFCILLSHSGITEEQWFLEQFPEIDLCLGGHSHTLENTKRYSQSGLMGEKLGRITLEITEAGIFEVENVQMELEEIYDEDFDMLLTDRLQKTDAILSVPLPLFHKLDFDAFNESELINFICDALKKDFECDLAVMHAGIAECALTEPVSPKSLIEGFPSKLNPAVFSVTGKALKEAVILSFDEAHIRGAGRGAGSRGHVLGTLGFSHNVTIRKEPLEITIDGYPLIDDRLYKIAADDYLQRGSGYPSLRVEESQAFFDKRFIRDIVRENLMNQEVFETAAVQRIYEICFRG